MRYDAVDGGRDACRSEGIILNLLTIINSAAEGPELKASRVVEAHPRPTTSIPKAPVDSQSIRKSTLVESRFGAQRKSLFLIREYFFLSGSALIRFENRIKRRMVTISDI